MGISLREEKVLSQAIELYKRNSYSKALRVFEDVISLNSDNSEAYFYIGNIFHIQGELGKAIKAFNRVLELDPTHTDASVSLSVILNDIGHYEKAKDVFNVASDQIKQSTGSGVVDPHINKNFSLKHFEIAEMYYSYNRFEEALFEYNKASKLDSSNLEIRLKIAKVYSKKGFSSKALDELRKLKAENPSYIPARIALGLIHYGTGNILEAQSEWQSGLNKDPANKEIKMYLELSNSATETNLNL